MLLACSTYQPPEPYSEITLASRENKLQKHVLWERNNQGLSVSRLFGHLGSG